MTSDVNETGTGAVVGFQIPMSIKKRKSKIDEMLENHEDIDEGMALSYFSSMDEESGEECGVKLDGGEIDEVAEAVRKHIVREMIRKKVREVVRKKPGGGGWVLHAPNPGKKKKSKPAGTFPTKLGAKRSQLARFPPKDPDKRARLEKEVERLKNGDKKKKSKKESVGRLGEDTPFSSSMSATKSASPMSTQASSTTSKTAINKDPQAFFKGLKTIQGGLKSPAAKEYISAHLKDSSTGGFLDNLRKTGTGPQALKQLYQIAGMGSQATKSSMTQADANAEKDRLSGKVKTSIQGESVELYMHKQILATVMKRSLRESLFREEATASEWDEYISSLSKQALSSDSKFQKLQQNITKRSEGMLNTAFDQIRKAVGKKVKLKNFGMKVDRESGKSYLAFSADLDGVDVEPIVISIDGDVPKIEVSGNAKAAMMKANPDSVKMFRAELVTVQERILDEMDDLKKAVVSRDKYLSRLEDDVDDHVANLSPLQISILKRLLVKKYRKVK